MGTGFYAVGARVPLDSTIWSGYHPGLLEDTDVPEENIIPAALTVADRGGDAVRELLDMLGLTERLAR